MHMSVESPYVNADVCKSVRSQCGNLDSAVQLAHIKTHKNCDIHTHSQILVFYLSLCTPMIVVYTNEQKRTLIRLLVM